MRERAQFYIREDDGTVRPTNNPMEFALFYESAKKRTLAFTVLPGGGFVSTIFLGFDHSLHSCRNQPPVLWETLCRRSLHEDEVIWRYTNETDALAGHQQMLAKTQGGQAHADTDQT